jgi:hypothetical protein
VVAAQASGKMSGEEDHRRLLFGIPATFDRSGSAI